MEIVSILKLQDQQLLSVQYDDQELNEFELLFEQWTDIDYLEQFFNSNLKDLFGGYFNISSVEEAVERTIKDARLLQKEIVGVAKNVGFLDNFFSPLNNNEYRTKSLSKCKCKMERSWIRLYAIKFANNYYCITGGTIKLTHLMEQGANTAAELLKLDQCQNYFRSLGIVDEDGIKEY